VGYGDASDAECDLENIKYTDKHPGMEKPAQADEPHVEVSSAPPVECYWIDARNPEYEFKHQSPWKLLA
jgi:hypothetical protein